jgi:hypothetical protein
MEIELSSELIKNKKHSEIMKYALTKNPLKMPNNRN